MAEGGESWDEVTYLKKKTPRAAEAKSKKVNCYEPTYLRLCTHPVRTGIRL